MTRAGPGSWDFSGSEVAGECKLTLTSMYCRDWECVELYLLITTHCLVFILTGSDCINIMNKLI
jgi:hypothetical protein